MTKSLTALLSNDFPQIRFCQVHMAQTGDNRRACLADAVCRQSFNNQGRISVHRLGEDGFQQNGNAEFEPRRSSTRACQDFRFGVRRFFQQRLERFYNDGPEVMQAFRDKVAILSMLQGVDSRIGQQGIDLDGFINGLGLRLSVGSIKKCSKLGQIMLFKLPSVEGLSF